MLFSYSHLDNRGLILQGANILDSENDEWEPCYEVKMALQSWAQKYHIPENIASMLSVSFSVSYIF